MSATENRRIVEQIFERLSQGDGTLFIDTMADDFQWRMTGSTRWSRTYRGKHAVRTEMLEPIFTQFADRYTNTAQRIIAENDYVVVQCRGCVTTKAGTPYNNEYCFVIRFVDGKIHELTEYLDTQLVTSTFG
jgi:ketosteroid isomerase-like protein